VKFAPFLLFSGCLTAQVPTKQPGRLPYDLSQPAKVFELPSALMEVSALTDIDSITVACVQDEQASMYKISLKDGQIVGIYPFGGPADMEGLTNVNGEYFALRSDGLIYHLQFRLQEAISLAVVDTFRLDVPNKNIEGLGFDERNERILISPKDFIKGSKETKDERMLYAIDPKDPAHKVETVLKLSLEALSAQAVQMGLDLPTRTTDDCRVLSALKLRYSSVAVNPFTDHYYLLSAADRTLLVVDRQGALVDLVLLDAHLLPKPEGITFMANGDMWLASEGKERTPVLAKYAFRK